MAQGTDNVTPAEVQGGSIVAPEGAEQDTTQQAPQIGSAGAGKPQDQAGFYGYTFPDGTRKDWASREEMDKAFRDSFFREKDYTQKSQGLAEERKAFEAQQAEIAKQQEEMDRMRKEYDDFQWMINNRPEVYQYLQKQSQTPPDANSAFSRAQKYADDQITQLKNEIKELKDAQLNRDLERQRDTVFEELGKEFPDFDRQRTSDLLDQMGDGNLQSIARVLYHADRGMRGTQAQQTRLAETAAEKQAAQLTPSGGSGKVGQQVPKDLDAAAKLAEREYAGIKPDYE